MSARLAHTTVYHPTHPRLSLCSQSTQHATHSAFLTDTSYPSTPYHISISSLVAPSAQLLVTCIQCPHHITHKCPHSPLYLHLSPSYIAWLGLFDIGLISLHIPLAFMNAFASCFSFFFFCFCDDTIFFPPLKMISERVE